MPRVAVVGAGFAGLAAACDLQRSGLEVTVLEARRRVGGRVRSATLANGAVVELGAEWVEERDRTVRDLARDLGVALAPVGIGFIRREVAAGTPVAEAEQEEAERVTRKALARLDDVTARRLTLGPFVDNLPLRDPQRRLLRARLQGSYGADLGTIALRSLGGGFGTEESAGYLRAAAGNQSLGEAMARRLGDLRLGREVVTVGWSERGVSVLAAGGEGVQGGTEALQADAAVLAVPHTILARLEFRPALPEALGRALAALPMGVAAKLAVATAAPPPLRARQDVAVPYWCWTGRGADGHARPALTAFAGSRPPLETLRTAEGDPGPWLARLRALNPDLAFEGDALLKDWSVDPLARGCYSAFDNPSWDRTDLLSRPAGRLAFAGEHTAGMESGTMEGALRSGLRAAEQVRAILSAARPGRQS